MPANTVYVVGGCPDLKASAAELWPCGACAAPHGFGRDDEWLPFAHTRDKMRPSATGVFSYHAAGCSDLELHVGRTLLARNRVHLAMRMTQLLGPLGPLDEAWPLERRRLYPGGEPLFEQPLTGLSDRDAIEHVARWVAWHDPGWTRPNKARFSKGLRYASLGFLLAEAARGAYLPRLHRERARSRLLHHASVSNLTSAAVCEHACATVRARRGGDAHRR